MDKLGKRPDLILYDDLEVCKHLNGLVRTTDSFGMAYCPDCKKKVFLSVVINNLLNVMRKALHDRSQDRPSTDS